MTIMFSLITKDSGILTKSYRLVKDKLKKDSSQCFLDSGYIETKTMKFSELPRFLDSLTDNQAITHGVSPYSPSKLVAKRLLPKFPNAITRTMENFVWPDEGIIMFDYDVPGDTKALTKLELITAIRSLHPELEKAAMVWRPSASSNIVGKDGTVYKAIENQRIYVKYKNPEGLEEFINNLNRLAWDKDFGYIFITAAGTGLPRCLFDNAVFSPERLDFAAGAACLSGLNKQKLISAYIDGGSVDLNKVGDVLSSERYTYQVESAKRAVEDKIGAARTKYIEAQVEKLVNEHGVKKLKAKRVVSSRLEMKLLPADVIYTDDMGAISIMQILANPETYHGMVVRDPLEPEYGPSKAKLFIDDDGVTVNSFAHGGRVFRMQWDKESLINLLESTADAEDACELVMAKLGDTELSPVDDDAIITATAKKLGVGKGIVKKQYNDRRKQAVKEKKIEIGLQDLSHNEITERLLAILPETAVSTEGQMYAYNCRSWVIINHNVLMKDLTKHFDGLPKCSRLSDYKAIISLAKDYKKEDTFFADTPPVIAMKDTCWKLDRAKANVACVNHDKKYRIRFVLPFETVPDETPMPMFDGFCDWAFETDPTQVDLMQEIFGATIFGVLNRDWHRAIFFQGKGGNGKGVMLDIIKNLIPKQYSTSVPPDKFGNPVMMAMLAGKLLNTVPELPRRQRFPSAAFKSMVDSGELVGKELYQPPFIFPSTSSHLFSSNYRLNTGDLSDGMRRRWLIIHFGNKVTAEQKIAEFGVTIAKKEAPQIMNWARKGVERLYKNKQFTVTASAARLESLMFDYADYVKQFIEDEDIFESNGVTGKAAKNNKSYKIARPKMYKLYMRWCEESRLHNRDILGKVAFQERLVDMGAPYLGKHIGDYFWFGVRVKSKSEYAKL